MKIALVIYRWRNEEATSSSYFDDEALAAVIAKCGPPESIELRIVQQYPEPLEVQQRIMYQPAASEPNPAGEK